MVDIVEAYFSNTIHHMPFQLSEPTVAALICAFSISKLV